MFVIGIDPDLRKSGMALIDTTGKKQIIKLGVMKFHALEIFLLETWKTALRQKSDLIVVIEAGWLNPVANYHTNDAKGGAYSSRVMQHISGSTGRNEAVGMLLAEYCGEKGIPYKLFRPNRNTPKWNNREFKMITGWSGTSNQEERDAVRAAWMA
jgi:hypothetical protein